MSKGGEPHTYNSLRSNSIRLLYLHKIEEPLRGRFVEHILNAPLEYRALRHTWSRKNEESKAPSKLWIDETYLELDDNVLAFIKALSPSDMKIPIWIDAICIDQGNLDEKMQQIPLMGKIYSAAFQTLVWLGPASKIIEDAFRAIPDVNDALGIYKFDPRTSHLSLNRSMPTALIKNMDGICSVIIRTWFQRLWTMQEYVLAKEIIFMCGKAVLGEDALGRFVELYNGLNYKANEALMKPEMYAMMFGGDPSLCDTEIVDDPAHNAFTTLPRLQSLREIRKSRSGNEIDSQEKLLCEDLAVLIHTFEKKVSVGVDSILGLLGMLQSPRFQQIPVSKDATEADVYTAAMTAVLAQQHSVNNLILLHYTDTIDRLPGLPSWVPNFKSSQRTHTLSGLREMGDYLYNSTPDSIDPEEERIRFSDGTLDNSTAKRVHIKGRIVDEIVSFVSGHDSGWQGAKFATFEGAKQEAWEQKCNSLARVHARGKFTTHIDANSVLKRQYINQPIKDYPDSYRAALVAGSITIGKSHKRCTPTDQTYKQFVWRLARLAEPSYNNFHTRLHESENPGVKVNWDFLLGKDTDHTEPLYIAEEKEEYHARMFEVCRGRSFFVTKGGRVGVGGMVAEGDKVVVFSGGRTPFIVRRKGLTQTDGAERSTFELVGEAYVFGIMDRELFGGDVGAGFDDEWITLE